ncbi:MoaD/ThiS family protein [Verrucomicrobiales bacterium]|jgi:molybdopterin converting factor small subunit|nr:MoaD/ThiS family protein [Verrucomicrobiales bacterium]MDA9922468.1 MoaD/ThiS family protein [Verrucomicrobiales bacterium]MDB2642292.1 MoaD/ThiS family protein [bacterium]MDC0262878.1 MoaD/ThiS family protein [Verrucomicrobiales bacterium]
MTCEGQVTILFFSVFREITGKCEWSITGYDGVVTLRAILDRTFAEFPGLKEWEGRILCAVNCEYADESAEITSGDEIALMPPVQGG